MKKVIALLVFVAIFGLVAEAGSTTLDCDGRIVVIGYTKAEVLLKCGEPDFKDSWQEELTLTYDPDLERRIFVTIEEWTYNFGPTRFLYILRFKNGRLIHIRTGEYGY